MNLRPTNMKGWLVDGAIIFFILLCLLGGSLWAWQKNYDGKIYPGVYVANVPMGNLTQIEAKNILNKKIDILNNKGLIFYYKNKQLTLKPIAVTEDADSTQTTKRIISFDTDLAIQNAYALGRSGNLFQDIKDEFLSLSLFTKIVVPVTTDNDYILAALKNGFSNLETAPADAKLSYQTSTHTLEILPEQSGAIFNYDAGLQIFKNNLSTLDLKPIPLTTAPAAPKILKENCFNIDTKAQKLLTLAPITFTYQNKKWIIDKEELLNYLKLEPGTNDSNENDKINVILDYAKIQDFVETTIRPKIRKEAIDAKYLIQGNKMKTIVASKDGVDVDMSKNINKIISHLSSGSTTIEMEIMPLKSTVVETDMNSIGIKEIIGTGISNFSGSPKNRRINIRTGANAVNGTIIKPGEEFSLLKTLGHISSSTGYLPELVIKNNKTEPDIGGGLCQISTTVFRGALSSGLPITMRRNHSYRVRYYEPAGTDAAIYDPAPDFRFLNDTKNYILIQTRIDGNNLYFDFWGTKDGRVASTTKPDIFNIVKPKDPKMIETEELKPGEQKCTESAHNGADASFDYTVAYADGQVKEKKFFSHYVPWQKVCLIGIDKIKNASSTADILTTEIPLKKLIDTGAIVATSTQP